MAAAKRLVVLFSPSLPPSGEIEDDEEHGRRGKMISDRCPRSSTRRSPFLALALFLLLLPVLPLDTPLSLFSLFLRTTPVLPRLRLIFTLPVSPSLPAVRPQDPPTSSLPTSKDHAAKMPELLVIYPGGRVIYHEIASAVSYKGIFRYFGYFCRRP